ncbi:MAG TPA: DUF3576 domain-containing protein, partial [Hellea balneolensis]|nr:DUF3576 domain-containing protein [Hellea balneolensis]
MSSFFRQTGKAGLGRRNLGKRTILLSLSAALVMGLTGCGTVGRTANKINPFNGSKPKASSGGTQLKTKTVAPRMGVNEYLWRASLETLNFMPLAE